MILSVTGHRPNKLPCRYSDSHPNYEYIKTSMREVLVANYVTKGISGMALGIDQMFAESCVELNIPFIAAVPFQGQESVWPRDSQIKYKELLAKAYKVVTISIGGYSPHKMQVRNEFMVNNSDALLACIIPGTSYGGTFNCVEYAKTKNKNIIYLNPIGSRDAYRTETY